MKNAPPALVLLLLVAACGPKAAPPPKEDPHVQEVEAWRAKRKASVGSEYSWFSVTGLFWLKPGSNVIGSAADAAVRLPPYAAPAGAGELILDAAHVTLVPAEGAKLRLNDAPVQKEMALRDDMADGGPDRVFAGAVQFYVIRRGKQIGVRIKDPASPARKAFHGFDYFPIDPKWRIVARLERYDAPKDAQISTVVETTDAEKIPGKLHFEVDGKALTLEPFEEEGRLWIVFRDQTAGQETYGLGRFLYADIGPDDTVVLDFNKAYNPPCGYNDFTTCPIPLPGNRLPIRVEAGEKTYTGVRVSPKTAWAKP